MKSLGDCVLDIHHLFRRLLELAECKFLIKCGRIDVLGGVITLMILAYVTFGLRVWVRHGGKTWASEDWVMAFATVSDVTETENSISRSVTDVLGS